MKQKPVKVRIEYTDGYVLEREFDSYEEAVNFFMMEGDHALYFEVIGE